MTTKKPERQTWSSRLTYVLTVAGATVGFGATWRFPYLVGEHGGGAYVLLFCLAMILIGIPMILVENVIGRRLRVNSIDAFGDKILDKGKGISKYWKIIGYMGLLGAFGIMAYYMVLGGWVITYIINLITGTLDISTPITKEVAKDFYEVHISNSPLEVIIYTALFAFVNYIILAKGIIGGIERAVRYLMPLLFIFLIGMVIRNITLPGAMEGITFYLKPDFSKITAELFIFVLGQVFFALSLGFGVLITLSSYLNKEENLIQTAIITGFTNTIIAVLAGFMIFPSLFTFGIEPNAGPTLVFQSLPIVFSHLWAGKFFAIIFFGLLLIAALTTAITIYEVIITTLQEKLRMRRSKAIILTLGGIFLLGNVPAILGDNVWKNVTFFGKSIFDAFDFVSGNILFMLTALGCAIFVGFVLKDEAKKELSPALNSTFIKVWFNYVKFVVPFIILVIFISNLI
ncbi:sodium-dependent transporter [Aggregatibacter actinomycetemcomitans]|uniref:sodium-dependent transporter n=2 Tax=Aggregatibacter actinomycetemcomitans TaxID=714 RepID=UPI000240017C|nr:sodium-dependent transporter [Aggregatibacter actinomycetemcomitans]EHK91356.1 SoxR-reducing system protein RsxE [Aggregatibacter actinomycetemcomitans RhAA1]KNE78381.1 transporter [Aggregatibacter actinomycetemcomitans RhAA1]KYK77873.1 transporter [Aggregatibacter actinomycetemcomitans serotype e str. SC936]MBN6074124.1 sodium-dependent transporter [Aggregatibacter actinomycetemcomitans]MBN6079542.1 sodium-dependent transporter [Aggregatibacter actinomycetemcomitans]